MTHVALVCRPWVASLPLGAARSSKRRAFFCDVRAFPPRDALAHVRARCVVAMPYEQAREACNRLLVELDEDIRNYIIDMLGGDESEEEMKAAVSDFLVSTEHCADEDAAMVKVTELFASLSAATPADPATLNAELRILDATVSLAASADDKLFREKVPLCR